MIDLIPITNIINEDGTSFTPPITNEWYQLKKKYPPCNMGFNYKCMYCGDCLYGDYFRPNEDEKQILDKQRKVYKEYLLEHNQSLRKETINEPQNTT